MLCLNVLGCMISVKATQLDPGRMNAIIDNMQMSTCDCVLIKLYSWIPIFKFDIIFTYYETKFLKI